MHKADGKLNDEQRAAIEAEGHVLLVACPGSGKTHTLIHKIASELEKINTHREFVVALTYTHVAADEIRERVSNLGICIDQLWIGTIHSFCLEWILNPYHIYHDDLRYGFRIIDTLEQEDLLDECAKSFGLRNRFDCNHHMLPGENEVRITSFHQTNARRTDALNAISLYHDRLRSIRAIDFQLLLRYSYDLISDRPIIAKRLNNLFRVIVVDEYQDTQLIQYHILAQIFKANNSGTRLFMVGDPNQAIFTSLGGLAMNKAGLEDIMGAKVCEFSLVKNYRSSARIIDYFSHFMVDKNALEASGENCDYRSIITHTDDISKDHIVSRIARILRYNVNTLNIDPSEICIVAPWWMHLAPLTRQLVCSLPEFTFNGPGLSPFGDNRDNIWYKIARIALTEPSPQLFNKRILWARDIIEYLYLHEVISGQITARDFLMTSNEIVASLSSFNDNNSGVYYLQKFFNLLIEKLDINIVSDCEVSRQFEYFFKRTRKRIDRIHKDENINVGQLESFKKFFRLRSGVIVSTIHGVKGEEYDTVIAFGLLEGFVPHFSESSGKEESAKRTLFVVASRARKNIWLISENDRFDRYSRASRDTSNILKYYDFSYDVDPIVCEHNND